MDSLGYTFNAPMPEMPDVGKKKDIEAKLQEHIDTLLKKQVLSREDYDLLKMELISISEKERAFVNGTKKKDDSCVWLIPLFKIMFGGI